MTGPTSRALTVWHLGNPGSPEKVGTVSPIPGSSRLAFRYDPRWIDAGFDLALDMPRRDRSGRPNTKDIVPPRDWIAPGAIDDAMPDRWGQQVIRIVDNPPSLSALDFLYLAGDRRFGALGFSRERDAYVPHPLPPLPQRASLAEAADLVEKILSRQSVDERERLLLASSKTMGGARPKMLVEIDGGEWIAKLPRGDAVDLPLVEHATMLLARDAGIRSAETAVHPIPVGHALLVRRFDRTSDGGRVHVLSARSMMSTTRRPSYSGMAQLLRAKAPSEVAEEQRREVFVRLAFNALMDNSDDHDKNHACARTADGRWVLSEAYDLLPQMNGDESRGMPVGRKRGETTFHSAVANHDEFGLTREEAVEKWFEVAKVVDGWRERFSDLGVTTNDIAYLAGHIDGPEKAAMRRRSIADALEPEKAARERREPARGPNGPSM